MFYRTKHEPILSVEFVVLVASALLSLYLWYRPSDTVTGTSGQPVVWKNFVQEHGLTLTLGLDCISLVAYLGFL